MNFELWVWGDGVSLSKGKAQVWKTYPTKPDFDDVYRDIGWCLVLQEFYALDEITKTMYKVMVGKDSGWQDVFFSLEQEV